MAEAARRSTLSYANAHRPWQLYEGVFYKLLKRVQACPPGKKFRFRNKLLSLDATVIELCASMFGWARFRSTKGALKLHLLLDHDGHLPLSKKMGQDKPSSPRTACIRRQKLTPNGRRSFFRRRWTH